jgi:4-aminobutyrate aminotransferase-like enzyme
LDTQILEPKTVVAEALKKNLLILGAGNDVIRLVPPLTVSIAEIDLFIVLLDGILNDLNKGIE